MRMKRVGWAVDYLDEARLLIKDPEEMKGRWKEILPDGKLHVEIGCGKGKYSLDLAEMNPQDGFVAVEVNDTAAGLAVKKFDEESTRKNLRAIHDDAKNISQWFAPKEVDVIHLNFSDPWPKTRHAKRRLSSKSFLSDYLGILSDDGQIEMKTDNASLFEYSVTQFSKHGFYIEDLSVNWRAGEHEEDPITEYEAKFMELGQPIYRAVLKKAK